jgi:CDP-diacylglycerol--glycerol-3-phosphate 3-phosphatidyltransferase
MTGAAPALFDRFKPGFRRAGDRIASVLVRLGVSANAITLTSVAGNGVVAILLSQGSLLPAGIVLLLANSLDFLDGAVARASGRLSDFGAFLDSVCDRYAELLVFLGLVLWYGSQRDTLALGVTFVAMAGSLMVSYTRARAEGLGYAGEVGLLARPERIVLMAAGLLLAEWLLFPVLVGLAVLTHVTALQRVAHVHHESAHRSHPE